MVTERLSKLNKTTKAIAGAIGSLVVIFGAIGASYSQVVENLKEDFTPREEFAAHAEESEQRFNKMDSTISETKDAVDSLTEVVLSGQISDLRATIAQMEDNRANWKTYEADIYREKKEMLEYLQKQRDKLRGSQ